MASNNARFPAAATAVRSARGAGFVSPGLSLGKSAPAPTVRNGRARENERGPDFFFKAFDVGISDREEPFHPVSELSTRSPGREAPSPLFSPSGESVEEGAVEHPAGLARVRRLDPSR